MRVIWLLLCLLVVPAARLASDGLLPGDMSYYHLRMARQYADGFPADDLLHGYLRLTPFHLLLWLLGTAQPVLLFFPALVIVLSLVLFHALLRVWQVPAQARLFTFMLLAISPVSVFAGSTLTEASFSVLLVLFALWLFVTQRFWLSLIVSALAVWQSVFNLAFIVLFLGHAIWTCGYDQRYASFLLLLFGAFLLPGTRLEPFPRGESMVTDFGATLGMGIFMVILVLLGLRHFWHEKYKHAWTYAMFVGAMVCWLLLGSGMLIYLHFYFAYLAGWGLQEILGRRWESRLIRQFTVLLLFCGLLFSYLSYTNRLVHMLPDISIQEAGEWVAANTPRESVLLATPGRAFWLEFFAQRRALSTPFSPMDEELTSIFYSRNLGRTVELLQEHGVDYIWIDREMRQAVWSKEEEGLLFLFKNRERFRKVYDEKGIAIWRVL